MLTLVNIQTVLTLLCCVEKKRQKTVCDIVFSFELIIHTELHNMLFMSWRNTLSALPFSTVRNCRKQLKTEETIFDSFKYLDKRIFSLYVIIVLNYITIYGNNMASD